MTIKMEHDSDDDERTSPNRSQTDSKEQTSSDSEQAKWGHEALDRMDMLKARFGLVRPGTEELRPGCFYQHWKVDDKIVNQGQCYYNEDLHTYYVRPRERRPSNKISNADTIYFEIERENVNAEYRTVAFHMARK